MEEQVQSQTKQWDPGLYDRKHSFVWKYGEEMVGLLAPQKGELILDLGCGTGHLTHQIAQSGARVTGIDKSAAMIERARAAYPDLEFVEADAAEIRFPKPFDAVFSNAALHWMKPPAPVVVSIARALRSGGRLVAEFGGKGNLKAIHGAMTCALEAMGKPSEGERDLRYYPSIGEYASLLEQHGLATTYATLFDRPTLLEDGEKGLGNWIETFGGEQIRGLSANERQQLVRRVRDQLVVTQFRNGTWIADYRRIRIIAVRE